MKNIMCVECGVMPCKRGAKKYCSRECCLKNTSVQNQKFDKEQMYSKRKTWNKGIRYTDELKSRLDLSGLSKGLGYFKGKKRPDISGENSNLWVPYINKSCAFCTNVIKLKPNQIRNRDRFFCNRECWAKGTTGKGSPVFKGDEAVSRLRHRVMSFPEYKTWRQDILKRDNYTCQICDFRNKGKERRQMEVDHIKRFISLVEENGITTPEEARGCKELWDISNGRTLCRPCHRTTDTYGTKGLSKLIN